MTNITLISVEPGETNQWCQVSGCMNETAFHVKVQIGNLVMTLHLCHTCMDELLKEVTT